MICLIDFSSSFDSEAMGKEPGVTKSIFQYILPKIVAIKESHREGEKKKKEENLTSADRNEIISDNGVLREVGHFSFCLPSL